MHFRHEMQVVCYQFQYKYKIRKYPGNTQEHYFDVLILLNSDKFVLPYDI